MDMEHYNEDYRDLAGVSEKTSDILNSAVLDDKLRERGLGSLDDNMPGLARIRLTMPLAEKLCAETIREMHEQGVSGEIAARNGLWEYMDEMLAFYSPEKQKAILLEMYAQLQDLRQDSRQDGHYMSGVQQEVLKWDSVDELKEKLTNQMLAYVRDNFPVEKAVSVGAQVAGELEEESYCAGASAGAIYLNDEDMRNFPESVGVVTGAAESIADNAKTFRAEDVLQIIGIVLLEVAMLTLSAYLLQAATFTFSEVANLAAESVFTGELFSWAALKAAIADGMSWTSTILLKIAAGSTAGGLAAVGADQAIRSSESSCEDVRAYEVLEYYEDEAGEEEYDWEL